jgi:diacylglycerol kinase
MRPPDRTARGWRRKFGDAFRGVKTGIRGQSSFFVHFFAAAVVVAAAAVLRVGIVEWCLLAFAIFGVLAAEMFNSALEWLAKAITNEHDPRVGQALDIGGAAVLTAALGAVVVGGLVFARRLIEMLG